MTDHSAHTPDSHDDEVEAIEKILRAAQTDESASQFDDTGGDRDDEAIAEIDAALDAGSEPPQDDQSTARAAEIPRPVNFALPSGGAQAGIIGRLLCHLARYPDIAVDTAGRLRLLLSRGMVLLTVDHLVRFSGGARFSLVSDGVDFVDLKLPIAKSVLVDPDPDGQLFRKIARVMPHPFVEHSGAVISGRGYEPLSMTFVQDGVDPDGASNNWIIPSSSPTRDDAVAALKMFQDLLAEFWFEKESDRAAAIALLITACQPTPLRTRPFFYVNARSPGTGKSLLLELAEILADGSPSLFRADFGEETDPQEFRKAMVTMFVAGAHLVVLDNVSKPVRSALLERWLTSPTLSERILGGHTTFDGPPPIFGASGNSLKVNKDGARRAIFINQNTNGVDPSSREFSKQPAELTADVIARRREFICAAITIVKYYVDQGSPSVKYTKLGSFEEWVDYICKPLIYLGVIDPLSDRDAMLRGATMELEQAFGAFLLAVHDEFPPGSRPWTARHVVERASAVDPESKALLKPDLHAAVAGVAADGFVGAIPRLSSRYLGIFLSSKEDTPYSFEESLWPAGYSPEKPFSLRVRRSTITTGNHAHWKIEPLHSPDAPAPSVGALAAPGKDDGWLLPILQRIAQSLRSAEPSDGVVKVDAREVQGASLVKADSREEQQSRLGRLVCYAETIFADWKAEIAPDDALALLLWRRRQPAPPHTCTVCGAPTSRGRQAPGQPMHYYCAAHDPLEPSNRIKTDEHE